MTKPTTPKIEFICKTSAGTSAEVAMSWKSLQSTPPTFVQILEDNEMWETAEKYGKEAFSKYKCMVILGSGGSSIGTQVIYDSLGRAAGKKHGKTLQFIDNVDPQQTQDIFAELDFGSTLFFVVSKSGKTMETLSSLSTVLSTLESKGLRLQDHVWIVTDLNKDNPNPLEAWARTQKFEVIGIPNKIGGRFSVLTNVGLIPARFLGLNLSNLKAGASEFSPDFIQDFSTQALKSFDRGEWISFFWCYSWRLKSFGLWLNQLWAESLAKESGIAGGKAPRVSTPMWALGTQDQHSVLQQVMEGAKDKFVVFVRNQEAETMPEFKISKAFSPLDYLNGKYLGQILSAEAEATQQALGKNNISTAQVRLATVNEASLAALFMNFQWIIALMAKHLEINAFDQPGVELGKNLAREIISSGKL